jgi:hypothetical protein
MSKNELLDYSLEESTRVFTPLYLNDLFWLNHLVDNPVAYDAYMWELIDKWTIPDEEQRVVEHDIEKYCPKPEDNR